MANVAISLGIGIGANLLIGLLSPRKTETIEGSRAESEIQRASLGSSIPLLFGTVRVNACPIFWSPKIKEVRSVRRRRVGAKGGSTRREVSYTYYGNFAVLVGESPDDDGVSSINRIWLNGDLYYNNGTDVTGQNRPQSGTSQQTKELRLSQHLELYRGTATQTASSTIQSFEGTSNVPGYRRYVYIVFRDLPLENIGNRLPRVDVEVIERSDLKVSNVIRALCELSGLEEDEDFTLAGLDTGLAGYKFGRGGNTTRSAIEELQQTFLFLGRDKGSKIEFFPFDRSICTLSVSPFQLGKEGDRVLYARSLFPDTEIPRKVQLEAKNIFSNHDPILKSAFRASKLHDNTLDLKTSIVCHPQQLADSATKLLEYLWLKQERYEGITIPAHNVGTVNAGDRVNVLLAGRAIEVFVQEVSIGADYTLQIEGTYWNGTIDSFVAPTQPLNYEDSWELPDTSDPVSVALDIPLVSDGDSDYGLYAGLIVPDSWITGELYARIGSGDFNPVVDIAAGVISGTVANAIPARSSLIVDDFTTIDVVMESSAVGTLSSCTYDQFLAYRNLALIGNELIAFMNAVAINATTYRLSRLLRGCRGTESAIATHTFDEKFYLVKDSGFIHHEGLPSYLGQTATYKGVPNGGDLLSVQEETLITITGEGAKPYAPVNPVLSRNVATGELILSWDRRSRRDGDWRDNVNVPIGEDSERYEVVIGSVSYFVNSPSCTFTGTTPVTATVYQLSGSVGRGKPLIVSGLTVSRVV